MKIAFVVSWLNQYGGAERVLEAAHEICPDAPVWTSIYDPSALPSEYQNWQIRVSFLDRLPQVHRRHQLYLLLYPLAFQSLRLEGYDLVVSITSAFAHGVTVAPGTPHLCYCLTPARFLWQYPEYVEHEAVGRGVRAVLPLFLPVLRDWDRRAARRVNEFVSISRVVQERISRVYGRTSPIIFPPVDVSRFHPVSRSEIGEYYLIVSRLVPYKRVDLAVAAFTRLGLPLLVGGEGRDRARLEKMAGSNVRFLGRISDEDRRELMSRCRALIFPGEEDFGITPLEANASGRPVIAFAGGGALETVSEGVNGTLFAKPNSESLARAVQGYDTFAADPAALRAHAGKFDVPVFQRALSAQISRLAGQPLPGPPQG